jgi:hypothetical protein
VAAPGRPGRIPVLAQEVTVKNLLALLGALVVAFAGVGWYLDWYKIQSSTDSAGHREVNIDLNTKKINADISKGAEKVEKVIEHKQSTGTDNPTPPPPNPQDVTVRPNTPQPTEILVLPGAQK